MASAYHFASCLSAESDVKRGGERRGKRGRERRCLPGRWSFNANCPPTAVLDSLTDSIECQLGCHFGLGIQVGIQMLRGGISRRLHRARRRLWDRKLGCRQRCIHACIEGCCSRSLDRPWWTERSGVLDRLQSNETGIGQSQNGRPAKEAARFVERVTHRWCWRRTEQSASVRILRG